MPMIAFTSFVWNVAAFGDHPNNLGLTILGLLIMSLGCVALAYIGGRSGESAEGRERGMSTGGVVALSRLSAKSITSRASGQGRNSGEVGTEMLSNKLDVPLVDQTVKLYAKYGRPKVDKYCASTRIPRSDFHIGFLLVRVLEVPASNR